MLNFSGNSKMMKWCFSNLVFFLTRQFSKTADHEIRTIEFQYHYQSFLSFFKLRKLLLSRYYPVIKQFDEMFCLSSSHFLVWFIIYVYCLEHTMPKFISLPNRQQLACSMVFLYFSCSNKTNIHDLLLHLFAENTYLYSK